MQKDTIEVIMAGILLILSILVINPGGIWMPDMLAMCIAGIALVVFASFAIFIWRAKSKDERERLHTLLAGQYAFLLGAAVVCIGLVIQSIRHEVDPWLAAVLTVMMLTRVASFMWARRKK